MININLKITLKHEKHFNTIITLCMYNLYSMQ